MWFGGVGGGGGGGDGGRGGEGRGRGRGRGGEGGGGGGGGGVCGRMSFPGAPVQKFSWVAVNCTFPRRETQEFERGDVGVGGGGTFLRARKQ